MAVPKSARRTPAISAVASGAPRTPRSRSGRSGGGRREPRLEAPAQLETARPGADGADRPTSSQREPDARPRYRGGLHFRTRGRAKRVRSPGPLLSEPPGLGRCRATARPCDVLTIPDPGLTAGFTPSCSVDGPSDWGGAVSPAPPRTDSSRCRCQVPLPFSVIVKKHCEMWTWAFSFLILLCVLWGRKGDARLITRVSHHIKAPSRKTPRPLRHSLASLHVTPASQGCFRKADSPGIGAEIQPASACSGLYPIQSVKALCLALPSSGPVNHEPQTSQGQ
ncbi:hypothetical protein SKAU_G00198780 [Synaphobranchus kaupii]|uniref:Uncharacterized protein n=1 Tax=Synaphobranchus kaupii TaxID=118154 RepID=A0A9Q1IX32_SYNKA|nr:hypothetical protein SKAU_G00198780 [Synaphobranchus kaupii]